MFNFYKVIPSSMKKNNTVIDKKQKNILASYDINIRKGFIKLFFKPTKRN